MLECEHRILNSYTNIRRKFQITRNADADLRSDTPSLLFETVFKNIRSRRVNDGSVKVSD